MKLDLVLIEHDLSRLVEMIQELKSMSVLSLEAEGIVSNMFSEICKVYLSIRRLISPYFVMEYDENFKAKFAENFENYRREWLDPNNKINSSNIYTIKSSCVEVVCMLDDLSNRIDWRVIRPSIRNEFDRVKRLRKFWFLDDRMIDERMEDLLIQLRDELSEIDSASSDHDSFTMLQTFISEAKPSFAKMESQIDNLCNKEA